MNIQPLIRFLDDANGTRWTVLFAGPLVRRTLPGKRRHIVFRMEREQIVAEHDWVGTPLSDAELLQLLERSR